jgi:hypothetical protein
MWLQAPSIGSTAIRRSDFRCLDLLQATSGEHILHAALELSKNSWLLAIQFPERDKPSLHPIKGGDTDGLMAKRDAARERLAKLSKCQR